MKSEIKQKWVEALRSGEYKQGASFLNSRDCFCCLGVLCDLNFKEVGEQQWKETYTVNGDLRPYKVAYDSTSLLPFQVAEWAGLDINEMCGNEVLIDGVYANLASHNDKGCTFEQIANAIEEQL